MPHTKGEMKSAISEKCQDVPYFRMTANNEGLKLRRNQGKDSPVVNVRVRVKRLGVRLGGKGSCL